VEVSLSWKPIPGAEEYQVFRNSSLLATIPAWSDLETLEIPTSYTYEDKSAKPSSRYEYVIVANNSLGSTQSTPVIVSTPASSAGVFVANFSQDALSGQIFLKKSSGRVFSGYVLKNEKKSSFRGVFDFHGNATIKLSKNSGVINLKLLEIGLEDGSWDQDDVVYISSDLETNGVNILSVCRPGGSKKGPTAPLAGQIVNILLESRGESGVSFGQGFANFKVGKNGAVKVAGKLADGSNLSGVFYMVQDGRGGWALPFALRMSASKSFLNGEAAINSNPETDAFHFQSIAPWTWTCPPNAKAKTFAAGFQEKLDVKGRVWSWTKGTSVLGGSSANFTLTLTAPSGFLMATGAESLSGSLSASNKPTWSLAPPKGFSMKITPTSGLVSGKVPGILNGKAKILSYQGLIFPSDMELDSGTTVRGAGFLNGSGASGAMELIVP
jgi:hypothetical protein